MQKLNENLPCLFVVVADIERKLRMYRISKSCDKREILCIGTVSVSSVVRYPTPRTTDRAALSITAERSMTPPRANPAVRRAPHRGMHPHDAFHQRKKERREVSGKFTTVLLFHRRTA